MKRRRFLRGGLPAILLAAAIFLFLFTSRGGDGLIGRVQDAEAYPWIKFGVAGSASAEPVDNEICNEILTSPTFDTGDRCWAGYTWNSPKMGEDLYVLNMIHPCSTYHIPNNVEDTKYEGEYTGAEGYKPGMHNIICYDVGDPERGYDVEGYFVRIVNEDPITGDACLDGKDYCLESQFNYYQGGPVRTTGMAELNDKIEDGYKVDGQYTGDSYWLVGNEPDSVHQDAMNGSKVSGPTALGPRDYAAMYEALATRLEIYDPDGDVWAVFCQASFPHRPDPNNVMYSFNIENWGLDYCETAYDHYINDFNGSDSEILAWGVHSYFDFQSYELEMNGQQITTELNGYEQGSGGILSEEYLDTAFWQGFVPHLQVAENWVDTNTNIDYLWLTEWGALQAFCKEESSSDPLGYGCKKDRLIDLNYNGSPDNPDGCSPGGDVKLEKWHDVFYGGHAQEGLYGLMVRMHDYLLNHSHKWGYAAWFVSKGGQNVVCETGDWTQEPTGYTSWVWGHNYAPKYEPAKDDRSTAGCLYNETMAYWLDYPNDPIVCP